VDADAGAAMDPKEAAAAAEGNIVGTPTHGGYYMRYNIFGNLFEVSAKYVTPIRPIGRGAYGIVWFVSSLDAYICSVDFFVLTFILRYSSVQTGLAGPPFLSHASHLAVF
jgi:hypothetical protein